jgi:hypothetical protein
MCGTGSGRPGRWLELALCQASSSASSTGQASSINKMLTSFQQPPVAFYIYNFTDCYDANEETRCSSGTRTLQWFRSAAYILVCSVPPSTMALFEPQACAKAVTCDTKMWRYCISLLTLTASIDLHSEPMTSKLYLSKEVIPLPLQHLQQQLVYIHAD